MTTPRDRTAHTIMMLVAAERNLFPGQWVRHANEIQDYLEERMSLYRENK